MVFFVAAIATLGLASCKKAYDCECEVFGSKITTKTDKMSKADAKKACEDGSAGMCKLK